jgi:uncharacterized protein
VSSGEAVIVRASAVHGRGLYVTRPLRAGEVATRAHALVLEAAPTEELAEHPLASYLVDWDGTCSAVPFGPLSFVNHDDDPNAQLVVDHEAVVVELVTLRAIAADEELTVAYGEDHPL